MRESTSLPEELAIILFEAGSRKAVLLEGKDDKKVFTEWFVEHLSDLEFFDCNGYQNVEDWVEIYLQNSERKQVFGIRDRDFDFEEDELVERTYEEPNHHLFVLRKRCIENYLIVPDLIFEIGKMRMEDNLVIDSTPITSSVDAELAIFNIIKSLKTLTSANWLIRLDNQQKPEGEMQEEHFAIGFPPQKRSLIIQILAQKLNKSTEETEQLLSERETVVENYFSNVENSHKIINGKMLLHHIRQKFGFGIKAGERLFFNMLVDRILLKNKVHSDLKFLIEEKILPFNLTN